MNHKVLVSKLQHTVLLELAQRSKMPSKDKYT